MILGPKNIAFLNTVSESNRAATVVTFDLDNVGALTDIQSYIFELHFMMTKRTSPLVLLRWILLLLKIIEIRNRLYNENSLSYLFVGINGGAVLWGLGSRSDKDHH
jgi:hypothetical protein